MFSVILYYVTFAITIFITWIYQQQRCNYAKGPASSSHIQNSSLKSLFYEGTYIWLLLIVFIPVIILGFRYGIGTDYFNYHDYYDRARSLGLASIMQTEPLFLLVSYLGSLIAQDYYGMLLIVAFLTMYLMVLGLNRFRDDFSLPMAMLVYLALLYGPSFNIIRQTLAVSVIMLAFRYLEKRRFYAYAITVLVATLFHTSAIICLPLYFINVPKAAALSRTKKLIIVAVILALPFMYLMTTTILSHISYFAGYFKVYDFFNYTPRWGALLVQVPVLIPVLFLRKQLAERHEIYDFYIFLFLLEFVAIYYGFYMIWAFRLMYYFFIAQIILIPATLEVLKEKSMRLGLQIYYSYYYIGYFFFTYYMSHSDAIFPYMSIFNQ